MPVAFLKGQRRRSARTTARYRRADPKLEDRQDAETYGASAVASSGQLADRILLLCVRLILCTFRTSGHVRLESVMRTRAHVRRKLQAYGFTCWCAVN